MAAQECIDRTRAQDARVQVGDIARAFGGALMESGVAPIWRTDSTA